MNSRSGQLQWLDGLKKGWWKVFGSKTKVIEILTLQCIVDLVSQLVEGAPLGHPIRDHVGVLANISDPYDGFDDDDDDHVAHHPASTGKPVEVLTRISFHVH